MKKWVAIFLSLVLAVCWLIPGGLAERLATIKQKLRRRVEKSSYWPRAEPLPV